MFKKFIGLFLCFVNIVKAFENIDDKAFGISWNQYWVDPMTQEFDCQDWIKDRNGKFSDSIRVQILNIIKQLKHYGNDSFLENYLSPSQTYNYTLANWNFVALAHYLSDIYNNTNVTVRESLSEFFKLPRYENHADGDTIKSTIHDVEAYVNGLRLREYIARMKTPKPTEGDGIAPGVKKESSNRLTFLADIGGIMTECHYKINGRNESYTDFNENPLQYMEADGVFKHTAFINPPVQGLPNVGNRICWFISLVQCLANIPTFCEYVRKVALEEERHKIPDEKRVATHWEHLLRMTRQQTVADEGTLKGRLAALKATVEEQLQDINAWEPESEHHILINKNNNTQREFKKYQKIDLSDGYYDFTDRGCLLSDVDSYIRPLTYMANKLEIPESQTNERFLTAMNIYDERARTIWNHQDYNIIEQNALSDTTQGQLTQITNTPMMIAKGKKDESEIIQASDEEINGKKYRLRAIRVGTSTHEHTYIKKGETFFNINDSIVTQYTTFPQMKDVEIIKFYEREDS